MPKSIPKFYKLEFDQGFFNMEDHNSIIDTFFNKIIQVLTEKEGMEGLKKRRAWLAKDAAGSVGEAMYGLYIEYNNDGTINWEFIKGKFVNQIYEQVNDELKRTKIHNWGVIDLLDNVKVFYIDYLQFNIKRR